MRSSHFSLPRDWLKRCTEGVQPPECSTRSQERLRGSPKTPPRASCMTVTPSTRSLPLVPVMA